MKNLFTKAYALIFFSILCPGIFCTNPKTSSTPQDYELATAWADLTNQITRSTPANTPTFASRCFGYIGLTMYESVVPGSNAYNSVAPQLNGLDSMPVASKDSAYNWPLALNASQAEIIRLIYIQTGDANKKRIDSLEQLFLDKYTAALKDDQVVSRSVMFGKAVAKRIFEWSVSDGGHRGYLRNFEKDLKFEDKPGGWKPALYSQSFSHHPLHPKWGANRCFLAENENIDAPVFISYDTTKGSLYYNQFIEVYNTEKALTQGQKEIAIWWSDDPDETPTPPGHSYYLASLVIRKKKPDLIHCAETYAKLGMAVSDAYRNCWKWKYMFFSERPNTYITAHIDEQWRSFWPDPPFPAFPSGHAIQAAAAASVLTELYGDDFAFTDSIHANRHRDDLVTQNLRYANTDRSGIQQRKRRNQGFMVAYIRDRIIRKAWKKENLLERTLINLHGANNIKMIKAAVQFIFYFFLFVTLVSAQHQFKDVTDVAGIQHEFKVYESMFGGGACVLDYDNDGNEDIYITGGMNDDRLYRNNGNGTFSDVFPGSGLELTRKFVTQGVASADLNRDGFRDLLITTITRRDEKLEIPRAVNLLFLNNGNGTFRDVTKEYGMGDMNSFSTGCSFGDINADGWPDIYIGNYFNDFRGKLKEINDADIVASNQTAKGYLLINKNGKKYFDAYKEYGLDYAGYGFGGVFTDLDNDRDQDIIVYHDFGYKRTPNIALKNEYPDKILKDVSKASGLNVKINSMAAAPGDYNNDGDMDYFITNIGFNYFMVNEGGGKRFYNYAKKLGLNYFAISWGANFSDFDQDGDLDLFVSNGDLNPNCKPMADFYFENMGGQFKENAAKMGLADYGIGRGSVVFDFDKDGDEDILVVNQVPELSYPVKSVTHLFRNDGVTGNWIRIALKGESAESNGLGSRIEIDIKGKKMIREIDGGSASHLSQNSVIAHFGVGDAKNIDKVTVYWTGGNVQELTNIPVNQLIEIKQMKVKKTNLFPRMILYVIGIVLVTGFIIKITAASHKQ